MSSRSPLESSSEYVAVGSLVLLGMFMLLSPATNIFSTLESAAHTTSWSLLAAIPALALAYVLGILTITAADSVSRLSAKTDFVDDARVVGEHAPPLLVEEYSALRSQQRLLRGATIGFVVLAAGIYQQGAAAPIHHRVGLVLTAGALILAFLSGVCARALQRSLHAISASVRRARSG